MVLLLALKVSYEADGVIESVIVSRSSRSVSSFVRAARSSVVAPRGMTTLSGTALLVALSRLKIAPPSPTAQPMVALAPKTPLKVPSALSGAFTQVEPVLVICALVEPETSRFDVLAAHTAFRSELFAEVWPPQVVPLPLRMTPPLPTAQMFVEFAAKTALSCELTPEDCVLKELPFQKRTMPPAPTNHTLLAPLPCTARS